MIIRRLHVKNFGKIHDMSLKFSPGINVLYGENESGKTTIHTFIKSMFYGITRQRGKAAKNDVYHTYEPWENPVVYGGTLWFDCAGKEFRLNRNFHKENETSEFVCEKDGEILDIEKGDLQEILGGVSEATYNNTVSVAQLKSVTGPDLVKELQNYMTSYQGTGDSSIDLGRAVQMLKMSRKGYQVQVERKRREGEKEQGKLSTAMEYMRQELDSISERQDEIKEKRQTLKMMPGENEGEELLNQRIRGAVTRKWLATFFMLLTAALGGFGIVHLALNSPQKFHAVLVGIVVFVCICFGISIRLGCDRNIRKWKRMKVRWRSQQEKLNWNQESLGKDYEEKEIAYLNLQEEYREYLEGSHYPDADEREIQALNLAIDTIGKLSQDINGQVGGRLRQRTSEILSEITGGKYQEIFIDADFRISVNTEDRIVPLERLSRGTLEQIYFALRMAAGELLCNGERFPVILDDVFGMYDEERLTSVLRWLYKEHRQIIISTCNKREMELLDKEGIPYQKLLL